ncbi:MAG: hypothetical protein H6696_13280 [Deferribacteres bacterium]|nr:hypothetical protein [candidate division KSB1 bacterium]MCB9502903.1 hypothetical protein [Deferribacteres bacterium]
MMNKKYIIGIDGGGTKSVGCLVDGEGNILAQGKTGATNYLQKDEELIVQRICGLVQELKQNAHVPANAPVFLAVGLSGLGNEKLCRNMENLLRKEACAVNILATSDVASALAGAFAGEPGAILISGTGSIAYGKAPDGKIYRVGGWGYLVGDEGAGFDIGRRGIAAALTDWDGRGEKTILRPRLEEHFKVGSINEAVPEIYVNYATRGALAKFAPFVFEAAREGDAVATAIINLAAKKLADHIIAMAPRINKKKEVQLALVGNIFRSKEMLLPVMQNQWQLADCRIEIKEPIFPAEFGAVLLMKESGIVDDQFIQNLQKTMKNEFDSNA